MSEHGQHDGHGHDDHDHIHTEPTHWFWKYFISYDHKMIAKQFLLLGIFWAAIGATLSLLIRWAVGFPGVPVPLVGEILFPHSGGVIPPDAYATIFTLHGTIMIFFAITPVLIGCFGNYCIPLMIGNRDMIFPWLNMASFWTMVVSSIVMLWSFFVPMGGSGVGWTSYPTLAHSQWSPGLGHTLWLISLFFAGTSSLMGAVNYVTTIIRLRAPGMGYFDMPLTIWGIGLASVLNALFIPVLTAGFLLLFLDRVYGTKFFLAAAISEAGTQGDPILYQHLFWIFGHPEVYIVILPAWGIVSDLLSFFSRKPAFGARATALSMVAISVLSTVVYGHHMFTTGLSPLLTSAFTTLTLLISIPSGIFFLNWLGTLWKGELRLTAAMWFSLGVVFTFGLGGLTGLHLGAVTTNIILHNTYFVVGHFHLTMAVAALLGAYAGVYFWFPKMFGRMMDERLGKIHFWLTVVPVTFLFCSMFIMGYGGMHRRTYNPYEYNYIQHLQYLNQLASVAAFTTGFAQLIFVWNFFRSMFKGPIAGKNPWGVGTLEWTTTSPPPFHNFDKIPNVYTGPHEFSHPVALARTFPPGEERDFVYQTEYVEGVSHKLS
jgi:cytochrome c oxidase subunit 1